MQSPPKSAIIGIPQATEHVPVGILNHITQSKGTPWVLTIQGHVPMTRGSLALQRNATARRKIVTHTQRVPAYVATLFVGATALLLLSQASVLLQKWARP